MKSTTAFFQQPSRSKRKVALLPIMSFLGLMIFLYGLFKYIEVFSDMKDIEEDNKGELDKMLQKTIGGFAELVIKTNLPLAMLAGAPLLQFLPQRENRIYRMAQFGVTSAVLLNEVSAENVEAKDNKVAERTQDDCKRVYKKLAEIISKSPGKLETELSREATKAIIETSIGSDDFGELVTEAINRKDIPSYETLVKYYLRNVDDYMTQIKGVISRLLWKQFSLDQFKDFCEPIINACRGNKRCMTTLWEENVRVDDKAVTFQTLILQNDATIFGYLLDQGLLTSHTIFNDGKSLVDMARKNADFSQTLRTFDPSIEQHITKQPTQTVAALSTEHPIDNSPNGEPQDGNGEEQGNTGNGKKDPDSPDDKKSSNPLETIALLSGALSGALSGYATFNYLSLKKANIHLSIVKLDPSELGANHNEKIISCLEKRRFQCNRFIFVDYGALNCPLDQHTAYNLYFKSREAKITRIDVPNIKELRDEVLKFRGDQWPEVGYNKSRGKAMPTNFYSRFCCAASITDKQQRISDKKLHHYPIAVATGVGLGVASLIYSQGFFCTGTYEEMSKLSDKFQDLLHNIGFVS